MTQTFSLDFNDTFSFDVKDGSYEVVCVQACENCTEGGTVYVQVTFVVRNDVAQEHQNQKIFHKIWQSKDTGQYNIKNFNTLGAAMQLQQGKKYTSLDDLLQDFVGKCALIRVKNEQSEYNGKTYDNLNIKSFNKTNFEGCNHRYASDAVKQNSIKSAPIQISDKDLPF